MQSHPCERSQAAVCFPDETVKRWKRPAYSTTTRQRPMKSAWSPRHLAKRTHGVHERNLSTRVFVGILGPLWSNQQYRIVSIDRLKSPRVVFTNSEQTHEKKTAAICFLLRFFGLAAISFLKFVNTTQGHFIWLIETMRFVDSSKTINTLVDKCVRVPPESVWQGDEVTKPISTVVVSWWLSTRVSSNVLLFHRGNKLPPGFARRDAIAWLES